MANAESRCLALWLSVKRDHDHSNVLVGHDNTIKVELRRTAFSIFHVVSPRGPTLGIYLKYDPSAADFTEAGDVVRHTTVEPHDDRGLVDSLLAFSRDFLWELLTEKRCVEHFCTFSCHRRDSTVVKPPQPS